MGPVIEFSRLGAASTYLGIRMEVDMYPKTKRRIAVATLLLAIGASTPALASTAAAHPQDSGQSSVPVQFEHGELVRLRSGGPLMTVSAVKGDQVYCVWTEDRGRPADATFPADVLQRAVLELPWR
jgi:uncharacterized protein YodC (DUF2158 family)